VSATSSLDVQGTPIDSLHCRIIHVSLDDYRPEYLEFLASVPANASRAHLCPGWLRGDINKRILDLSVLGGIVDDIAPPILTWGDYQALSYDWGDSKSTGTIYINSQPLEVPRNLEAALRVVQREMKPNTVSMMWADAICINQ
jgi:hypothetical protein